MKWQALFDERYQLTQEMYQLEKISSNFYKIELGEDAMALSDTKFFIYDFENIDADFELSTLQEGIISSGEELSECILIFTYKDWDSEQELSNKMYAKCKLSKDKKLYNEIYKNHISLYTGVEDKITLTTEDNGINYLENLWLGESTNQLQGLSYSLSFNEIKKLYNVTGEYIFRENVRTALLGHETGRQLEQIFKFYIFTIITNIISSEEASVIDEAKNIISQIMDIDSFESPYIYEHFWFYHNGITIFVDEEFSNSGNSITLNPKKISVINGAQTLTNLFSTAETIYRDIILSKINLLPNLKNKLNLQQILSKLRVKTVFIIGNKKYVSHISKALNTQIPIKKEDIYSGSDNVIEINKLLKKKLVIIKPGEEKNTTKIPILEFMKYYFIVQEKPGKSKNYKRTQIEDDIPLVLSKLRENTEALTKQLLLAVEVFAWWNKYNSKRAIEETASPLLQNIKRYAKNYFTSFCVAVHDKEESIDENKIAILYSNFEEILSREVNEFSMNASKKDDLFENLIATAKSKPSVPEGSTASLVEQFASIKDELQAKIASDSQSPYTLTNTIATFLLEKNITLPYFRTISLIDSKCTEYFPFSNSTFTEIYNNNAYIQSLEEADKIDLNRPTFEDSALKKELSKEFPIFLVEKDKDKKIIGINFFSGFSFKHLISEGKIVFEQTLEAFEEGDELKFPKISDQLSFHVRPKAQNAEDTFKFTNGEQIIRRTFWANKTTVEDIINKLKEE